MLVAFGARGLDRLENRVRVTDRVLADGCLYLQHSSPGLAEVLG